MPNKPLMNFTWPTTSPFATHLLIQPPASVRALQVWPAALIYFRAKHLNPSPEVSRPANTVSNDDFKVWIPMSGLD